VDNNLKRKYEGWYAIDEKSYIDIKVDGKKYLTLNVHHADGKIDDITAYSISITNFVYKCGRLLFLDDDNHTFNKIQLNLNNKTMTCNRILN
jgi:hypothetical protein